MKEIRVLFFGSTTDSVIILDRLIGLPPAACRLSIAAVVTQPPRPVGRKQLVEETPVEAWGRQRKVAVLHFATNPAKPWLYRSEEEAARALASLKADLLISAS